MSSAQKPLLSIIIVSYNVKDLLLECLQSLKQYIEVPHEVLVIDNASSDDTCAAIKEKFSEVILTENKNNSGFSAANNTGFAQAKGDYVLMLNPDACLFDTSFTNAFAYIQQNSTKNILLGPRIFNADKSFQQSAWKFPKLRQHFLESIFLNKLIDTTTYPELSSTNGAMPVDFVSGAAILMHKQTLDSIGPLDEKLFWMDDVDFCYRNQVQGGETIYFPDWKILHHIGQSSKKNLSLVISNQLTSKLKFYKKHNESVKLFLSIFIFLLHVLLRIILLLPASLFSKNAFAKWKAYAYAFKKLFRYLFLGDESIA